METRVCSKCGNEYPLTQEFFYKNKARSDGIEGACKLCRLEQTRKRKGSKINRDQYIKEKRELFNTGYSRCMSCGLIKINEEFANPGKQLPYYCKCCYRELQWFWRIKRRGGWMFLDFWGSVYNKNSKVGTMTFRSGIRDEVKKASIRKNRREAYKAKIEKYNNDFEFKLMTNIRNSINKSLSRTGSKKHYRTHEYLGCSPSFFKRYIENLFEDWMTWENRNEWHLDHIRPISSFDLSDKEQVKECWNYRNIKPISAGENTRKNSWYNGVLYRKTRKKQ
jgi:hypothetical protein